MLLFFILTGQSLYAQSFSCQEVHKKTFDDCLYANSGRTHILLPEQCHFYPGVPHGECTTIGVPVEIFCQTLAQQKMTQWMDSSQCVFMSTQTTTESEGTETDFNMDETEDGVTDPATEAKQAGQTEGGQLRDPKEVTEPTAGTTMSDLQADLDSCRDSGANAQRCCTRPQECGAGGSQGSIVPPNTNDPEGIKRYCEQMKYAGLTGQSANSTAAGVCSSNHVACSLQCSRSKQKWERALSSCSPPNCDPNKVQQAISIFSQNERECRGLEEAESLLAQQSGASYSAAQQSQLCAQQAAMDLSSLTPQNQSQKDPAGLDIDCSGENANRPECIDCSKFPNSPACGGGNLTGSGSDYSSSGWSSTDGTGISMSDFNVGGHEGLGQSPVFSSTAPQEAQGKAVPNGGGGGLPGSSPATAGMTGSGTEGGTGAASGYNTDILDGERSGGGFSGGSGAADDGSVAGGGGGFSGYGGNSGDDKFQNKFTGLDLKQYLPGGSKDPSRNVASAKANDGRHPEIAPMGVSMFKKISERFEAMCKLKQLIGCE